MASNSKNLGELLNTTQTVSPAFVSDQDNTSTGYFDLPNGTTAQRPSPTSGMIRYNSTLNLAEYYDGSQWKSIDAPPVVSSISPTTETDANANITITGSFFSSGATVKFIGDDGTEYTSPSVTFNSVSELIATTPSTALSVANEPYDIKVENPSGLSATLADALDAGGVPAFTTAAGTVNIYDSDRSSAFDAGATDPDSDTITYSVSSGSLPTGASLNTATGAITGFSAVGSDTASTFTISAATASDTSTRTWTLNVKAPVITSYTSVGSGTFSVPSGLTTVDVLVVAGGGSGGGSESNSAGGGGAGGLIYRPAFPVTPGGSVSYTVGNGGAGGPATTGSNGQDSVFGGLTSKGGGRGSIQGGSPEPSTAIGLPGGSGGGSCFAAAGSGQTVGSTGTQPQQPGDSGTYGFGNPGGQMTWSMGSAAATGGGGAGAASQNNNTDSNDGTAGGIGKQYDISGSQVYYAGGGGADGYSQHTAGGQGGGGMSGGQSGTANRGGGGSGGANGGPAGGPASGGSGGSGIVIVKY